MKFSNSKSTGKLAALAALGAIFLGPPSADGGVPCPACPPCDEPGIEITKFTVPKSSLCVNETFEVEVEAEDSDWAGTRDPNNNDCVFVSDGVSVEITGGTSWSSSGVYEVTVSVVVDDSPGTVDDPRKTLEQTMKVTVHSADCCRAPSKPSNAGGPGDDGEGDEEDDCSTCNDYVWIEGGPGFRRPGVDVENRTGKVSIPLCGSDSCDVDAETGAGMPCPEPEKPINPSPYMRQGCGGSECWIYPDGTCVSANSPVRVNGVEMPGWSWDAQTLTLTRADGSGQEFNDNGTLKRMWGASGLRETVFSYDSVFQDHVTQVSDSYGRVWSYGVDGGEPGPTEAIAPGGTRKTAFSYVAVGSNGSGQISEIRKYDLVGGNWLLRRTTAYSYNDYDQITGATTTQYDDNGGTADEQTTAITYYSTTQAGRVRPVHTIVNADAGIDLVYSYSTESIANETSGNSTYGVTVVRRHATAGGNDDDTADRVTKYYYYRPTQAEDPVWEGQDTYLFRKERLAYNGSGLTAAQTTTYKRYGFQGRFDTQVQGQANAKGQVWRLEDKDGNGSTYTYNADNGMISTVTLADGASTIEYYYQVIGSTVTPFVERIKDARGKWTKYERDSTYPALVTAVYASDTDSYGSPYQQSAYFLPGQSGIAEELYGLVSTSTVPDIEGTDDMVTSYAYDEQIGGVTYYRPGPTRITTLWKNGASYEDATVTNSYLPDGRLGWTTDALGNRTDYEYDGRGRLVLQWQPVDSAQAGTATAVNGGSLQDSTKSWLTGELLGMALVVTSGNGEGIYDVASGSGTSVTAEQDLYAAGVRTGDTYELRPYTQTAYSECCNLAESERDERGSQTYYTYDPDTKRLTEVRNDVTGDSSTYPLVQYEYNDLGQTTEVRTFKDENDTSGRLTSYEYDQLGRVKRIVYPKDGGTTLIWDEYYQYDAAGNLVAKLQGAVASALVTEGTVTVYAYDALGRVQYVEYDRYDGYSSGDKHWPVASGDLALGSGDVSYTYSGGSGLKTQMVDSAGTSQYAYDARGRLTSYTPPKPAGFQTWYSVAYAYNNLGQKTQMTLTTPSSAQKVTKYLYFRDGSLKDVRWPTSTWPPTIMTQHTYLKNGPRNLTAYGQLSGEGWYHTFRTYNDRAEMTGIKHRHSNHLVGGTQWNQERIAEVVYGLDAGGNPLRIDEYYDAAGNYHRSDYEYDEIARLTDWTFGGNTKSWTYDWVGNWLTSSDGTFVTDPDVDWLDSSPVPSATYEHNKLGALEDMTVSANTDTFSYDDQDLLSQVSYGGGGSSTMVWDADQQRQKLTNSGGSTYFVYDPTAGVPAVLVETDGENETFYVREPGGELIARAKGETRQYYFFDRLGTTIAMVPAVEGNPTDRLFYTPWGELVTSGSRASTVGTTANPHRYVGQLGYYYHHQDAGLQNWMQLGVRFYQPEIGRFERRDPEELIGLTSYGYADLMPLLFVDPDGRTPWGLYLFLGRQAIRYGNYCGPQISNPKREGQGAKDDVDECCKQHDDNWKRHDPPCTAFNQWKRPVCTSDTVTLCHCVSGAKCADWNLKCKLWKNAAITGYCEVNFACRN